MAADAPEGERDNRMVTLPVWLVEEMYAGWLGEFEAVEADTKLLRQMHLVRAAIEELPDG